MRALATAQRLEKRLPLQKMLTPVSSPFSYAFQQELVILLFYSQTVRKKYSFSVTVEIRAKK